MFFCDSFIGYSLGERLKRLASVASVVVVEVEQKNVD